MTHILLVASEQMDMHTKRLVEMLLNYRHHVTLVAREEPGFDGRQNYKYFQYPHFQILKKIRPHRLRRIIIDRVNTIYLRYIWQRSAPDLVHNIYIGNGAYYCGLAGLSPLVLTALGSDINDAFEGGNLIWQERIKAALNSSSYITADTTEVLKRCDALAGKSLRSDLFYFGIDLSLFFRRPGSEIVALKKKIGIPSDAKVVLSPRRLTSKMRHDVVVKAFAEYKKSTDQNTRLVFRRFGSYSQEVCADLQKLAVELGIGDHVLWLDELPYEELPVLYSASDLIVNVPEQDGLPVTLFEASACKVPVVTSCLPSYQEFIDKGRYWKVAVGDVDGVAGFMRGILGGGDHAVGQSLEVNYDLIRASADQDKCFANLEKIYFEAGKKQ